MKRITNLLHATALAVLALFCSPLLDAGAALHAQFVDTAVVVRPRTVLRVAKWTALGASAGAAAYGFITNRTADNRYEELERLCGTSTSVCSRNADGSYSDPAMESRYQDVVALDRRANGALLASQLGMVTAVALFIYDLRDPAPPRGIPYEPRSLQVIPGRDGVQLRMTLPVGRIVR